MIQLPEQKRHLDRQGYSNQNHAVLTRYSQDTSERACMLQSSRWDALRGHREHCMYGPHPDCKGLGLLFQTASVMQGFTGKLDIYSSLLSVTA